ncbi:hypothetical protein [Spiroplasma endosymbiont of Nomada rufipes]
MKFLYENFLQFYLLAFTSIIQHVLIILYDFYDIFFEIFNDVF